MVLNPDGRAVGNSSTSKWEYEYDVKDHLGNTRASFAPTTDKVKVLQIRDYYPFGLEQANWYVNDANATKFRYNGKELQDEGGLGWYDYGARMYDPSLGRWHVIDPLAEQMELYSPYSYTFNNPIKYFDPDGKKGKPFYLLRPTSIAIQTTGLDRTKKHFENGKKPIASYIDGNMDAVAMHVGIPTVMTGAAVAGTTVFGAIIAGGISESLLLGAVSPEVLFHYAVMYPRLYKYIIASAASIPGASTPGRIDNPENYLLQLYLFLASLEGDTHQYIKPDNFQRPVTENKTETETEI